MLDEGCENLVDALAENEIYNLEVGGEDEDGRDHNDRCSLHLSAPGGDNFSHLLANIFEEDAEALRACGNALDATGLFVLVCHC